MIVIPAAGQAAWLHLTAVLADLDTTPCTAQPEAWWPERYSASTSDPAAACGPCPARAACLAYAVAAEELHGIWGGLTPDQRRPTEGATP